MVGMIDGRSKISTTSTGGLEFLVASGGREYLLAVKMEFEFPKVVQRAGKPPETSILSVVPLDYRIIVTDDDDKQVEYEPVAVAFGQKKAFLSCEKLLHDKVELHAGKDDQPGIKKINPNAAKLGKKVKTEEAESAETVSKVVAYMMTAPQYVMLYKVTIERDAKVAMHHGERSFDIDLEGDSDWIAGYGSSDDLGAAVDAFAKKEANMDRSLEIDVVKGQLIKAMIDGESQEVYELEVKLSSKVSRRVDLNRRDVFLKGGSDAKKGRTTEMFVKLDGSRMRMHAGAEYFEVSYNGEILTELVQGDIEVTLSPGFAVALRIVFPDPPFESGLALHFPDHAPVVLIGEDDALGEIRPAFTESLIRVPQAPILGKPVRVRYLQGKIDYIKDVKTLELGSIEAAAGKRFMALKLDMSQGEQRFVARDYRLEDSTEAEHTPKLVAFSGYPALMVPGDEYNNVKLVPADTDDMKRRRGVMTSWELAKPLFVVVYELPESETKFTFKHGTTQLTIQPPTASIVAWNAFRPTTTGVGDPVKTMAKTPGSKPGTGKPADPNAGKSKEQREKEAQSKLRLAQTFVKSRPTTAKRYLSAVIQLVPGSAMAREAQQLLDSIKE